MRRPIDCARPRPAARNQLAITDEGSALLLGCRGDGQAGIAQRNHHGLRRVVQVGLAWPHGADRLVSAIELVEPGSVDVVHHRAVRVVEERRVPLGVHVLAGDTS